MAILRSMGKVDIASLHRWMVKEHPQMVLDTGYQSRRCISDTQLRRVLSSLDYELFNKLNERYFGAGILEVPGGWRAVDGKELRGNIDGVAGEKRGENLVRLVDHEDSQSSVMGFYHGAKASEKTVVKDYFSAQTTLNGCYSFDALHTAPALLEVIDGKSGVYLAQVKNNQAKLLEDCQHIAQHLPFYQEFDSTDKAHGRLESRKGRVYALNVECLEQRWGNTNIQTLIVVDRKRIRLKDNQVSNESAYFLANLPLGNQVGVTLFQAVRNHWAVEADNNVRDVTLGEDRIRCKDTNRIRALACLINIALNLMRKSNKNNNIKALREDLNFDRKRAVDCLSTS